MPQDANILLNLSPQRQNHHRSLRVLPRNFLCKYKPVCTYIGLHPFCYQKYPQVFAATGTCYLHTHLHFSLIMEQHSIISSHLQICWSPEASKPRLSVGSTFSFTHAVQDHIHLSWPLQHYEFNLISREDGETNRLYHPEFIHQGPTPAGYMARLSTTFRGFQTPLKLSVQGPMLSIELWKICLDAGSQKSLLQKEPNPGRRLPRSLLALPTQPCPCQRP